MMESSFTPFFSDAASFFQQQQQQQQQLPKYSQSVSDTDVLIICTKNHTMKRSNGTNDDAVINEIKDFYQLHNPDKLKDIDALLLKYTPTDLLQRIKEKYKKCAQPDLQPVIAGSPGSLFNIGTHISSSSPSFKSSNLNSTIKSKTSGVWSSSAIGLGNQWSNKPSQVTFGQSTHATGLNTSSSNPFSGGTKVADAFVLPAKASPPKFKPKEINEAGKTMYIQSICADDEYLQLSPEELQFNQRFEFNQSVDSPCDNTTESTTSSSVAVNTITTADTRSQATSLLPSASEAWIKVEPNNPNPAQFSIGGGTTISGKVSAIWIKCSR